MRVSLVSPLVKRVRRLSSLNSATTDRHDECLETMGVSTGCCCSVWGPLEGVFEDIKRCVVSGVGFFGKKDYRLAIISL